MGTTDAAADLVKKLQELSATAEELSSVLKLWNEAAAPFEADGEWKGQGWIVNARLWIDLVKEGLSLKYNPEVLATARVDARKVFHTLNELRDEKQRDEPEAYARFISEVNELADEARELIG